MTLNITGGIDSSTYTAVSEFLAEAGGKPVTIRINSGGGEHLDSLAIYSLIRLYPGKVTTQAFGCCYSAAVLIFAAGDAREAPVETHFMVHEDSGKVSGSTSELRTEVLHMVNLEYQWSQLMELRSLTSSSDWDLKSKATTYFDTTDAYDMGLVTKILKGKK